MPVSVTRILNAESFGICIVQEDKRSNMIIVDSWGVIALRTTQK